MTRKMKTGVALAALLMAAGCSQSMPSAGDGGPSPLAPAPAGRVSANRLPPPPPPPPPPPAPAQTMAADTDADDASDDATTTDAADAGADADADPAGAPGGGSTQVAAASPVTREGLVGAWKVSSGGGDCQIFMALTKWTGGYRAASRGCPGQVADVSAWDVSGSQVVLKDSGGSTVASLNSSGGTRYEGQTTGGQSISLFR